MIAVDRRRRQQPPQLAHDQSQNQECVVIVLYFSPKSAADKATQRTTVKQSLLDARKTILTKKNTVFLLQA